MSGPTGRALVRRPSPRLAEGLVTHIERSPVDMELALKQWDSYVDALASNGWLTVEVPRADDCPDSVFVEDTMVVFGDIAVLARPAAPSRAAEVAAAAETVAAAGYRTAPIESPGTLDGGDVLKIGSAVYVGVGGRTNQFGVDQVAALLSPLGAGVHAIPVTRVLHLKSAVTALPDGTVIGHPALIDDASVFPSFLAVPEESGSHVVLLGGPRVLMAASAPRSADLFRGMGYEPVVVDISEYEKLEGCVTCLSVRLRT